MDARAPILKMIGYIEAELLYSSILKVHFNCNIAILEILISWRIKGLVKLCCKGGLKGKNKIYIHDGSM